MSPTRERVVQVASEWLGTPFLARECRKGRGCDCGSLLSGVFTEAGVIAAPNLGMYDYLAAAMLGDGGYLARMREHAEQIHESRVLPGDIVMYRMGRAYSHAAIIVEWPRKIIHADARAGVVADHGERGRLGGRPRLFFCMRGLA